MISLETIEELETKIGVKIEAINNSLEKFFIIS